MERIEQRGTATHRQTSKSLTLAKRSKEAKKSATRTPKKCAPAPKITKEKCPITAVREAANVRNFNYHDTLFANHYTHLTTYLPTNWEEIVAAKKDSLYKLLHKMIDSNQKTNIQICIDGKCFHCHLCVLQVYSKFFEQIENVPIVKLPADKISQATFDLIYKWMLSDNPIIDRKHVLNMYVGAAYLDIWQLLKQCWFYFGDMNRFCEDSACLLYMETGSEPVLEPLRVMMLSRVTRFFLTFVASRDYVTMPEKHVLQLLSSNTVGVHSEIEILFAAFRWLAYKWEERHVASELKVMDCVRFHLMPLWFLEQLIADLDFVIQPPRHRLIHCVQLPEIAAKIKTAATEVRALQMNNKHADCMQIYLCSKAHSENARQCIRDAKCPYIEHLSCAESMKEPLVTYNDFLNYLKILHSSGCKHWKSIELKVIGVSTAISQRMGWLTKSSFTA